MRKGTLHLVKAPYPGLTGTQINICWTIECVEVRVMAAGNTVPNYMRIRRYKNGDLLAQNATAYLSLETRFFSTAFHILTERKMDMNRANN